MNMLNKVTARIEQFVGFKLSEDDKLFLKGWGTIVGTFLALAVYCCTAGCTVPGMAILADYEHGYAMCGKADPGAIGVDVLPMDGYTIYLNKGHKNDPQVQNLKVLALTTCK